MRDPVPASPPSEPWVSIDDVSAHLGVQKKSVYRWIDQRGLPAAKVGKLWKFKLSAVDAWMLDRHALNRPGAAPATSGRAHMRAGSAPDRSVLVIDDDRAARENLSDLLSDEGYRVLVAADGAEGLELLAASPRPDLVLLALKIPNVGGWRFREEQEDPKLVSVPVIVVTAASEASLDGVVAVLCEPLRLPVLTKPLESIAEGQA